jgi:hypothetical protein
VKTARAQEFAPTVTCSSSWPGGGSNGSAAACGGGGGVWRGERVKAKRRRVRITSGVVSHYRVFIIIYYIICIYIYNIRVVVIGRCRLTRAIYYTSRDLYPTIRSEDGYSIVGVEASSIRTRISNNN